MNERVVIAPVRKTVRVKAPIAHAFESFASGLTRWWPHDHGVGEKPIQHVLRERRLGGRWREIWGGGTRPGHAAMTARRPPRGLGRPAQSAAPYQSACALKTA